MLDWLHERSGFPDDGASGSSDSHRAVREQTLLKCLSANSIGC